MNDFDELKNCLDGIQKDLRKFYLKKNKSAGVRARKKLQKCKKLCQEIRNAIQKIKLEDYQKKAEIFSSRAAYLAENFLRKAR